MTNKIKDVAISITDSALQHIKKMLAKENGLALRLSIKKTGCSGYAYEPQIVNTIAETDILLNFDDVTIMLDTVWLHLLEGLKIDYLAKDPSSLTQKKLIFTNAKEKARCGCGESFQAE